MSLNNPTVSDAMKAFRDQMMPKAMPTGKSELAELIEKVDRLLTLLEPPSSVIISGKRAVEEYERLVQKAI